jgi:ABC-type transporter Mla subunit MlaD
VAKGYEFRVAKNSRVPSAVGSIPVVGDLVKQADSQAQWLQELIEQNARLVGQMPTTMKTFNDSLERFNQTVARLDKVVTTIEGATSQLIAPLEQVTPTLDRIAATLDLPTLRELPQVLDALRREALPALRAASDTQKQVALVNATLDRIITILNELPGAGIVRRLGGIDRKTETE